MKGFGAARWFPLAAVIALGAATLSLPACIRVDRLTGVEVTRTHPSDCVKACNEAWVKGLAAEAKTSIAQLKLCYALPSGPDRTACVNAELARFQAAVAALNAARTVCLSHCHSQGSGSAG
jgi:hypothetical protein